ncbi:coiled-coil-helix-coiled-coil-helix domain-containing protein 7-like [Mytilus galloprovincialis]|uniref:coiled-coil-helix-coiled-coil-helix domain-containing protein 7-like n=1 Tax=Mytilus galloprovincialis TaxID=29158 RepID=UPI003F7C0B25
MPETSSDDLDQKHKSANEIVEERRKKTIEEKRKRVNEIVEENRKRVVKEKLEAVLRHPCNREKEMSYQCLEDNGYDRGRCEMYFENYRNCSKFWNRVSWERLFRGIKPSIPPPDERDAVREEFAKRKGYNY